MGTGIAAEEIDLPPAAFARKVEAEDRHRAVARELHAGPAPRASQITEKLEGLRTQITQFRARAIELHCKLMELETQGDDDVRALRTAMMASVVQIEGVVRELIETPDPTAVVPPHLRFAEGTRVDKP